ncbi:MAG: hypothetical protein GKR94_18070 [Gammaproteobacteria bacterium]|nr:hypothetical protein [Gammaproteobacteria bacterium]
MSSWDSSVYCPDRVEDERVFTSHSLLARITSAAVTGLWVTGKPRGGVSRSARLYECG